MLPVHRQQMEQHLQLNLARQGKFKELILRIPKSIDAPIATQPVDFLMKLFRLLTGQKQPTPTPLLLHNSFNRNSECCSCFSFVYYVQLCSVQP